jgi:hypothetical protein
MRTIWKMVLQNAHRQRIFIPPGSRLLSVAVQRDRPCVWYAFDAPTSPTIDEERHIVMCGTGHPDAPPHETSVFVGTVLLDNGALVLHVFEDVSSKVGS